MTRPHALSKASLPQIGRTQTQSIFLHTARFSYGTALKVSSLLSKGVSMRNKEPSPIGRLRKHVRARFDAITSEELPQDMRELAEKLLQADPVKPRLDDKKPPRKEDE